MEQRLITGLLKKLDSPDDQLYLTNNELAFIKTPRGKQLIQNHKYYQDEYDSDSSGEDDNDDNNGESDYENSPEYDIDDSENDSLPNDEEKDSLPNNGKKFWREGDPKHYSDLLTCDVCRLPYTRANKSQHARSRIHKVHQEIREQLFRNALNNDKFRLRPTDTM